MEMNGDDLASCLHAQCSACMQRKDIVREKLPLGWRSSYSSFSEGNRANWLVD